MNEQIRAEFEQNFTSRYTAHKLGRMMTMGGDLADEYKDPRVNYCWVLWQAAHEMYAPRWISVEDSLPNHGEHVAFIADIPKESIMHFQNGKAFGGAFRGGEFPAFSYPGCSTWATHWMPLPKQGRPNER